VLVAVVGLLDPRELYLYARIDRRELWVALVVAVLGLTGGMLLGVAVGVGLTLALVIAQANRPRVQPLLPRMGGGWTTDPAASDTTAVSGVPAGADRAVVLHLAEGVYTGNSRATHDALLAAVAAQPGAERVVLECVTVEQVTVPLLTMLREVADDLAQEHPGVVLVLCGLREGTAAVLRRSEWFVAHEHRGLVAGSVEEALTVPVT